MTSDTIISITKQWIRDIVIGCNFCPFALNEFTKDRIHYQVSTETELEHCLETFFIECKRLDENPKIDTTLLILPTGFTQFYDYLDLVHYCEKLLLQEGYEGIYQLATFHPKYCFQGSEESDPANYTNRSPFPVLQLLREESIEKVLRHYSSPDLIPERNIAFSREMGLDYMKAMLEKVMTGNRE